MNSVKYLTFLLITTIVFVDLVKARNRREKDHKKDKSSHQHDLNLCSAEGNSAALHCFCVGSSTPVNITSAECWIFTIVPRNHRIWPLFSTQPHITKLTFFVRPQGQFTFIPTDGLRHLNNLKELQINFATISTIHSYAFANSSSLQELILSKNQIVTLDHHAFAHLTNLTELYLDKNRISELRRDVFIDLPSLQKLFVADNNLSVIQEGTFRNLAHLLELELDSNYISVLTRDTFTGLGELKRLDLSLNKINMLGDLTFCELWILEELNLEDNQIELISNRAFAGLNHLRKLNLSHNRLVLLSTGPFGGVTTIVYLDLRSNHLETLTNDNIQPIYNNLVNGSSSQFLISDNKLICDCRLAWIHRLHNETKSQSIRRTLDEIKCYVTPPDEVLHVQGTFPPTSTLNDDRTTNSNQLPEVSQHDSLGYLDKDDDYTRKIRNQEQQDSSDNYITETENKDPRMKHFFEIPLKELPCPQEEHPTEAPRTFLAPPGYIGIKSNCGASVGLNCLTLIAVYCVISLT